LKSSHGSVLPCRQERRRRSWRGSMKAFKRR
jgi:hypothetical protein